jgi:hypothetical protein
MAEDLVRPINKGTRVGMEGLSGETVLLKPDLSACRVAQKTSMGEGILSVRKSCSFCDFNFGNSGKTVSSTQN